MSHTPAGTWVATIAGWRDNHTVAWTKAWTIPARDAANLNELLAYVGAELVARSTPVGGTPGS